MMLRSMRENLPPVHREGWPFVAIALAIAVAGLFVFQPGFWIFLILAVWIATFFRDPLRVTPLRDGLVVSPADGRVEPIRRVVPPAELGLGPEPRDRVSIFMNVFDCHINRAPVTGRVAHVAYRPGLFVNADLDKASEGNERNGLVIETASGVRVGVVQIAGLVARRIVCWSPVGAQLAAGERFGMIRFGSRLDVFLPEGARIAVAPGQRAVAGETPLAWLPGSDASPPFPVRRD